MMLTLIFLIAVVMVKGDNTMETHREAESENTVKSENGGEAYESFGSPSIYGINNFIPYGGSPLTGKSAYNYPSSSISSLPSIPNSYAAYLANVGLNNPYAYGSYNRFSIMPYSTVSSLGYGAPFQNAYGYGYSSLLSGLSGYNSPYFSRSPYPTDNLGYPAYSTAGLGYRYGGPTYAPSSLRAAPVARASAPYFAVNPPVPRVLPPAPGGPISAYSAPAPVTTYPGTSVPVPIPAFSSPRQGLRTVQSKDGLLRYTYGPIDNQGLQLY